MKTIKLRYNTINRLFKLIIAVGAIFTIMSSGNVIADSITDRIKEGKSIRIGFANEVPFAYPGENNTPKGFVNAHVIGVLKLMGYENIKPVVTDWGGLIPGLNANRFDMITGGMFILKTRCKNITFSEPMGRFGDVFLVAKGNPKGLTTYKQIAKTGAVFVTGAGFNTVEVAKREGISDNKIMTVPSVTEILAAVKAGRADAGGLPYFTAKEIAKENSDFVEVTDPAKLPEWTLNWGAIGFRKGDTSFVEAFNKAQAKYLGSDEMLAAVAEYGYNESTLPGNRTTAWVCNNR